MKITDRLLADHQSLRKILDELHLAVRGAENARNLPRLRRSAALLKRVAVNHAAVEDQRFFPALARIDRAPVSLLDRLTREHRAIELYLSHLEEKLSATPPDPDWERVFLLLMEGFRGHFMREEEDVFPSAEHLIPDDLLHALGANVPCDLPQG